MIQKDREKNSRPEVVFTLFKCQSLVFLIRAGQPDSTALGLVALAKLRAHAIACLLASATSPSLLLAEGTGEGGGGQGSSFL